MPTKRPLVSPGRLVVLQHDSKVLKSNPLGDPHVRPLHVWLPPQYDAAAFAERRFPVLFDMVGFMGSGPAHTNWKGFTENVPERAARLIQQKKMEPAIIVFPDCFTSLGGNQYINSSAVGRYADYLTQELIPFVDAQFRTLASREHRGCFGKSSGGYGAIVHGMKYAAHWGAIADHSGDAYFDFVYGHDWPHTLDVLARFAKPARKDGTVDVVAREKGAADGKDDGRVAGFLKALRTKKKLGADDGHAVMMMCMAASYDPDPKAPNGFRLPYNLETGERIEARWNAVAGTRPDPSGRASRQGAEVAARHLHRLRRDRPVLHPLRHPHPVEAARASRHRPHVRGVRRQPLRHRLPDGRQPAIPRRGAVGLIGHRDFIRARCPPP